MQAQDLPLTQLLGSPKQFVTPIFQRTYSWEQTHCDQLWRDIVRIGETDSLDSHFIGSVVYIPDDTSDAAIPSWQIIDGQQRITTITLLLTALRNRLRTEQLDTPLLADQLNDQYLRNQYGKGDRAYRLLLTQTDRDTLISLIDGTALPDNPSRRIVDNFNYFTDKISSANLSLVWRGVSKLRIVDVKLQQGIDNPQMIFESMNSTGKALTQADLIRNYVLMALPLDQQTTLYENFWRPMEKGFGAENYAKHFDDFMRFYLVIHTGNARLRKDEVYDAFKGYAQPIDVETLLTSLRDFSIYYCAIALGAEQDDALGRAFSDIRELKADVCYPMLMELYRDHVKADLSHDDFLIVLRRVESYVFRRAVCDIPTNSLRQTFATFLRHIDKSRYAEGVAARFQRLTSYRRFPRDEEFRQSLQTRNLYNFNRRAYWLRRMENHDRKERVAIHEFTIEHIMPQNPDVHPAWQQELGESWQQDHDKYLHTLGNLTLTRYNSELSDRPFAEKRDMENGFAESPLKLNRGLGQCQRWNADAIVERAQRLAERAVEIWSLPSLSDEVIASHQPIEKSASHFTRADHPALSGGHISDLFDALRAELLSLDECVLEEYRKQYVAFKAETNFIDVVPQKSALQLTINMPFHAIDDPLSKCEDISDIGRWGNGDVRMRLDQLGDLPYAVSLARQSLESQLGDTHTV